MTSWKHQLTHTFKQPADTLQNIIAVLHPDDFLGILLLLNLVYQSFNNI